MSEPFVAIAKRLPHAINQLSVLGNFFNQLVTYIYLYTFIYIRSVDKGGLGGLSPPVLPSVRVSSRQPIIGGAIPSQKKLGYPLA